MAKKNIKDILTDPLMFISRLKIVNKKGKLVYLKPTEEQMTSLKFKKPKKAWGPGTNYKNYEEWKAVNLDSILDPIYMKQF